MRLDEILVLNIHIDAASKNNIQPSKVTATDLKEGYQEGIWYEKKFNEFSDKSSTINILFNLSIVKHYITTLMFNFS